MARSYPFGKVPASVGTCITESFERPMVDCGYCSTQFTARTARGGVSSNGKSEGHRIRALGGRAHWAGSNASEQRIGVKKALGVDMTAIRKTAVEARVKQGFAVTISLQYIRLPSYLKVQTNDFGHCAVLFGHRVENGVTYVGYFDPLYAQGSQGTWTKWADIDQALWDAGHNTTVVKYTPPKPPPVTPPTGSSTEDDYVTTPAKPMQVDVPKGKWLYTYSDFRTDNGNVQIDPARDMPLAGYTKGGDYAVGYEPSSNVPTNLKVMYLKKADGTLKAYPPPAAPPGAPTKEQILAIRKAEYERVTRGSIIQPPAIPT
jgi:hypothetical protein